MSLSYDSAYHCHCSVILQCGREIILKSLMQEMTYRGLLEGTPAFKVNDRIVQRRLDRVRNDPVMGGHAPFLIPPLRRDFFREPGDMVDVRRPGWIPEWMPAITCIGMFESISPARDPDMYMSCLTIVWFQDDYAMPISQAAMESIKSVDWNSLALDFDY